MSDQWLWQDFSTLPLAGSDVVTALYFLWSPQLTHTFMWKLRWSLSAPPGHFMALCPPWDHGLCLQLLRGTAMRPQQRQEPSLQAVSDTTLSVTLSAPLKQKDETIRELAVLLAFLFFPLSDTLVQPVCCCSLCQLARLPRRHSVHEGSSGPAWGLLFALCSARAAVPGLLGQAHAATHPGSSSTRLTLTVGTGDLQPPSAHHSNAIKADKFWSVLLEKIKRSSNTSILFQTSSLPFLLQTEALCSTTLIPMSYPINHRYCLHFILNLSMKYFINHNKNPRPHQNKTEIRRQGEEQHTKRKSCEILC